MPKSRRRHVARKKPSKIAFGRKRALSAQDQLAAFSLAGAKKTTAFLDAVIRFENDLAADFGRVADKISHLKDFHLTRSQKKRLAKTTQTIVAVIPHSPKWGLILIAFGGILLLFPTAFKHYQEISLPRLTMPTIKVNLLAPPLKPSAKVVEPIKVDPQLLSTKEPSEPPQRIVVPTLNVDLPIVEAKVVNGFWELSETSASHGVGSANPGEVGNTVIFAHARDNLFGPLRNSQKGTIIYVLTKDHWFKYQIEDTKLVDPSDVQVIAPAKEEKLTLYTCDGFLDSKRLIIRATPI